MASMAKRNKKMRLSDDMPVIVGKEYVITTPSNNSSSFSSSNPIIRFSIPSAMNRQISPFKTPRMTATLTYSGDANAFTNPYLGLHGLLFQLTVSSASKGIVIHQARNYARCFQSTELDGYGFQEISQGMANEVKSGFSYKGVKDAQSGVDSGNVNVSIPIFSWFLESCPDILYTDLQALGGLNIEIQLAYNPQYFIDGLATASYSLGNVRLHYTLLSVMPQPLPAGSVRSMFFRTCDSRQDTIQASSESKSISVSSSQNEGLIVDAVNANNQSSYTGDSYANSKLTAQTSVSGYNVSNSIVPAGFTGVTLFREAINGLSIPLNQQYQVVDQTVAIANSNTGLSPVMRETMKAQNREAFVEYGRTLMNLYTYDNIRRPNGANANQSNPLFNPASLVANSFLFGSLPVEKFKFGMLNRTGGSMIREGQITYKIDEQIAGTPFSVFHHLLGVKQLVLGGEGQLQVLE